MGRERRVGNLGRAFAYALAHRQEVWEAIGQHLLLVGVALGIGLALGVPLGIFTSRSPFISATVVNTAHALRVVPSLAILFLAIPYFGLSLVSPLVALSVLALPPILLNTDVALRSTDPALREAGAGMGMTPGELLRRVEIPLALPLIMAGVKTAAVEVIASATLAAFIGGGGLGIFITRGFALYDSAILLVGAVPVALLAILAEVGLSFLQKKAQVAV
jgi:osmoprotectant transport system permease protein